MLTIGTLVALGKTKIDDINGVLGSFGTANKEVVWLDISMDDSFFVDYFDSLDHLNCAM